MSRKFYFFLIVCFGMQLSIHAQEQDAFFIKDIYDHSLKNGKCYQWLDHLSMEIGGRLSGSEESLEAVKYTQSLMENMGMEKVWLQECMVPVWKRGEKEAVKILVDDKTIELNALALGNSVGTDGEWLEGEIVELKNLDDLKEMGEEKLKGKIVFFNRAMDPTQVNTFRAYGGAVDQRVYGASRAAKFGVKAVLVRSIGSSLDDIPHTGVSIYEEGVEKIPSIAISTNDAEMLSNYLKSSKVKGQVKAYCQTLPDAKSYNVIGEIKGSEFPDEIILVGGHLDSWDVGGGAHDDGSGCVHALQVLQTLIDLEYKPKRTIRCVMFMNEENGLAGGLEYAKVSNENEEYHLAAIESDAGGFTPRGFTCDGDESSFTELFKGLRNHFDLLDPYDLYIKKGGSGADINPLKSQKGILIGLRPDSQRYFDFHHTAADIITAVNERELKLGAAAMTSLVYLIDKHGL